MKRYLMIGLAMLMTACSGTDYLLYVGTYGSAIHVLDYDSAKGITGQLYSIPARNASFLAFDGPNDLYAVSECGDSSGVYAFKREDSEWIQTSYSAEIGSDPCHIFPVPGTDLVCTAEYSSGSFSVYKTADSKIVGRCQAFDQGGHIHQVREIPAEICRSAGLDGRYLLISDLGADLIYVERLDAGALTEVGRIPCPVGSGPRHMEFNTRSGLLYCLTELSGELIVWKVLAEGRTPAFAQVQRLQADPNDARGSADVHLHPNGEWLYTSHRLAGDGIRSWKVGDDGLVTPTGFVKTGAHPRNFCFTPDGRAVMVACRDTRSIQVFPINPSDGTLRAMTQEYFLESDKPVCLIFTEKAAPRR